MLSPILGNEDSSPSPPFLMFNGKVGGVVSNEPQVGFQVKTSGFNLLKDNIFICFSVEKPFDNLFSIKRFKSPDIPRCAVKIHYNQIFGEPLSHS